MFEQIMKNFTVLFVITLMVAVFISTVESSNNSTTERRSHRRPKIINGREVNPGELPYMVSIQANGRHWCGGAIISTWHVLTAAHCFINRPHNLFYDETTQGPLTVVVGTNNLANTREGFHVDVAEFIVSDYYFNTDDDYYIYDFCVMRLSTELDLTNNPKVKKIDLPDFNPSTTYDGQYATVSGFGLANYPGRTDTYWPSQLYALDELIWNVNDCNRIFGGSIVLTGDHVCGHVPRSNGYLYGTCSGDSGSPLVYNYKIIGIVSGGAVRCGEDNNPTIFTRVASWVPFIRKIMTGKYDKEMAVKRFY